MKLVARSRNEQNRAMLDPWSVVHFAAGLACGLVELPLRGVLPLAVLYEFVEQELESRDIGQEILETRGPESLVNAVADVAVFVAGHELGKRWNRS